MLIKLYQNSNRMFPLMQCFKVNRHSRNSNIQISKFIANIYHSTFVIKLIDFAFKTQSY